MINKKELEALIQKNLIDWHNLTLSEIAAQILALDKPVEMKLISDEEMENAKRPCEITQPQTWKCDHDIDCAICKLRAVAQAQLALDQKAKGG